MMLHTSLSSQLDEPMKNMVKVNYIVTESNKKIIDFTSINERRNT